MMYAMRASEVASGRSRCVLSDGRRSTMPVEDRLLVEEKLEQFRKKVEYLAQLLGSKQKRRIITDLAAIGPIWGFGRESDSSVSRRLTGQFPVTRSEVAGLLRYLRAETFPPETFRLPLEEFQKQCTEFLKEYSTYNSAKAFIENIRQLGVVQGGGVSFVRDGQLPKRSPPDKLRGAGRRERQDPDRTFQNSDKIYVVVEGPPVNYVTILEFELDNNGACILAVPSKNVTGGQNRQLPKASAEGFRWAEFENSIPGFVQMVLPGQGKPPVPLSLPPHLVGTRMVAVALFTPTLLMLGTHNRDEIELDDVALSAMVNRIRAMSGGPCYWEEYSYTLREKQAQ
jgi:hypothetical protein